ncbi:MAG TPA: hypothetical protein VM925_00640, partial [Labilithrix sp.]|nr:hypothetical protein [Labilithrix sp.]
MGRAIGSRTAQLVGAMAAVVLGAATSITAARWVSHGAWNMLPTVAWGLVLSLGGIACMRRRPSLGVVVGTQG